MLPQTVTLQTCATPQGVRVHYFGDLEKAHKTVNIAEFRPLYMTTWRRSIFPEARPHGGFY